MSTSYTPTQYRVNDPYQQRVLQFSAQDSRVYLSRVSNQLLKAFGNDAVIKGFDVVSSSFTGNTFEVVIDSGILIQDSTLIEVTEQSTLSIDVSGLDDCGGYLLIYTDYQYVESISYNVFSLKIAHTDQSGSIVTTDSSSISWIPARNRIYLTLFQFVKGSTNTAQEKIYTNDFYLLGSKYEKRGGLLNLHRTSDPYPAVEPFYYGLTHLYNDEDSLKLIAQVRDDDDDVVSIYNLQLLSSKVNVSISEYTPFTNPYKCVISDPDDANVFTINSTNIVSPGTYILTHNLSQQYLFVEVYDEDYNVFYPKSINFTSTNTLTIDFSNALLDLADSYTVLLLKENVTIIDILVDEYELIEVEHNLNKYNVMCQLADTSGSLYNNISNSIFNIENQNNIILNTNVCDLVEGTYKLIIYDNVRYYYYLNNNNTFTVSHQLFVKDFNPTELTNGSLQVNHNFDDALPALGMLLNDSELIYPEEYQSISEDITEVTFNDDNLPTLTDLLSLYIYSFEENTVYSVSSLTAGASGSPSGSWDGSFLTYDLDISDIEHTNPVFQVFNDQDKLIFPTNITELTSNEVYQFTFPSYLNLTDFNILVIQGFKSYSETFTTSVDLAPVTIQHELGSNYLFFNLFDETTNQVIFPDSITIVDEDSILLTSQYLSPSSSYKINIATGNTKRITSYSYTNSYYQEFSDNDIFNHYITITHDLDVSYPIVQVYDENSIQVTDLIIQVMDIDSVKLTFPDTLEIVPYYKAIILKPN
jgi:hypothetical protein